MLALFLIIPSVFGRSAIYSNHDDTHLSVFWQCQDVGLLDFDDITGTGPETYVVYSGQSGDAMLGDYTAFVRPSSTMVRDNERTLGSDTVWTLTARVNGEVLWIKEGFYAGGTSSSNSFSYTFEYFSDDDIAALDNRGDTNSRRALGVTYFSDTGIMFSSSLDSDHFAVALTEYIGVLCY